MAEYTPRLGLRKPSDDDFVDQTLDISENMDKIDRQFDPSADEAHTHDGVNSKRIKHSDLLGLAEGDPHPQYVRKDQLGPGGAAPVGADGTIPPEYIPAITDDMIGHRTIDQEITANPANTGLLSQVLSWFGKMIKAITGKANWYDTPSITLEGAYQHIINKGNPHGTTAEQVGAVPKTGGTFTGVVRFDVGSEAIALKPGAYDHVYLTFYADSDAPNTRSGYVGYASSGDKDLTIRNEMDGGNIRLTSPNNVFIQASCLNVNGCRDFGKVQTDPVGGQLGDECFNTTEKRKKFHDGTKWVDPMKYI